MAPFPLTVTKTPPRTYHGKPSDNTTQRISIRPLAGGGHLTLEETHNHRDPAHEAGPTHAPTPIPTIQDWAHLLRTHTHEEFAALALRRADHSCPPSMDISGAALTHPS
jgi:hypothetical protein